MVLETPEPNLSAGMRVLLGAFSQAWNRRYQRRGHVFQGRYKAVPVTGERAVDAHYFKVVADYIHLNPARAKLAGGEQGKLAAYPWSSLRHFVKGEPPPWLEVNRVLDAFQLSHDRRGRAAYVAWLESRAASHGGKIDEAAMKSLRQGWYLGEEGFKDKLLAMVDKARAKIRKPGHHAGGAMAAHHHPPFSPPSGPATGSFNGLHRESNFLAIHPRHSEAGWIGRVVAERCHGQGTNEMPPPSSAAPRAG